MPAPAGADVAETAAARVPRHQVQAFAAMVGVLVAAPFFVYPVFLMKALCFALFACAFNLLIGYVGLLSFGHAAFLGSAGYASAHAAKVWGFPPEAAIVFGTLVAALLGGAIGALTIRSRGIYFANITLAFAQMIFFFAVQASFTGGEDGMQRIPRNALLGMIDVSKSSVFYYVILALTVASIALFYRIVHSPFGEILRAIRDNEARVESLGFKPERFKLIAFVLSAAMAGLAGGMKATVFQFATLTDVSWPVSGEVILMTLLGGLGTLTGPMVGAGIVIVLNDYLAGFGEWSLVAQGAIMLLVIIFLRRGVVGELGAYLNRHQIARKTWISRA